MSNQHFSNPNAYNKAGDLNKFIEKVLIIENKNSRLNMARRFI
jgi:hypothetical protein